MLRKVDNSLFEGLEEVTDPVARFGVKWIDDAEALAKAVWKDVIAYCEYGKNKQAYKVMFLDGDSLERKWFYMTPKRFKALKRWNQHCEERLEKGVSYRDAWDILWWISSTAPEALKSLRENLHGYPVCSIELWNALAEITGDEKVDEKKVTEEFSKGEHKEGSPSKLDDFRYELWKKSIEKIEFLFREYNDDSCSMKNPHKFVWSWAGLSEEEKKEHDLYSKRNYEIRMYQLDCLHKGMKALEIFINHLWD